MSRTWKGSLWSYWKQPKGWKQAKIAGARSGAIPPDGLSSNRDDRHKWIPYKVATGLFDRGEDPNFIVSHLMRKFGLGLKEAEECLFDGVRDVERKRASIPEGLLIVFKEKELK
jgi:hypothetical protein